MPDPYRIRRPAFVGAGHAPPATMPGPYNLHLPAFVEASTLTIRRHPAATLDFADGPGTTSCRPVLGWRSSASPPAAPDRLAPMSASNMAQKGPGPIPANSRTRIPSRGPTLAPLRRQFRAHRARRYPNHSFQFQLTTRGCADLVSAPCRLYQEILHHR